MQNEKGHDVTEFRGDKNRKIIIKKPTEDELNVKSERCISFSTTESYHDKDGVLRQKTKAK